MKTAVQIATLVSLIAVIAAASRPVQAGVVKVGMSPPPLKVAKWVKGTPVTEFKKGSVYVVEFWATWCGPCKVSIPHLTDMAKKYAGKVTFTGVSVWEDNQSAKTGSTAYMQKVVDFVKEMGPRMAYNVAVDDPKGTMAESWMRAAGQTGIPAAFVIGRDSRIAWIGHPMGGLDGVLDKVLAGKFDAAAAAREREEKEAASRKVQEDVQKARALVNEGKTDEGFRVLDHLVTTHPEYKTNIAFFKFTLLLPKDEAAAYKLAARLGENELKDNAMMLNQVSWTIVEGKAQHHPDLGVATTLARRAVDLTHGQNPMILDTLAFALFKSGNVDEALSLQEKAVSLATRDAKIPAEIKKEITDRLADFKKAKSR